MPKMKMTMSTNWMINKSTTNDEFTTDNSKWIQINVYSNVYKLTQVILLLPILLLTYRENVVLAKQNLA